MIRALIVDDERRARAYLAKLVGEHADVEIIGEARDGASAVDAVERLRPDLVFLDVQMPEMNGLDVARAIAGADAPLVVFTTAYDKYALAAFELSATDYLLKPYEPERLARSLDRVRALLGRAREEPPTDDELRGRLDRLLNALEQQAETATRSPLHRLPGKSRGRIVLLDLDTVTHVASDDRLVFAHAGAERFLLNFSIKELEQRLPADRFYRTHRSSIVNLRHVTEILPYFHGKLMLKLSTGVELVVSEERVAGLRAAVGLRSGE